MNSILQIVVTFWNLGKSWAKSYTDSAIANLPKALVYKGAVDYYNDLPSQDAQLGDTYTVRYDGSSGTKLSGAEYAWSSVDNVKQWVYVGPDISGKADKIIPVATNNLAALDATGNLIDAGCTAASKADLVDGTVPKAELPLAISVNQMTLKITY